ncbi:MAG: hypothetical protein J7M09_07280 [Deltaproteobacteria bacterium]|nr:hypothetical protein [Candidatus Tharpella sp.]
MNSLHRDAPTTTILCANLADPQIPGFEAYKIFTINDKKVLVTSIVDPRLERKAIHGLKVTDPIPTLEKILAVPHDLAIAVLHFSDAKARRLVRQVAGLDIAILATQRGTMKDREFVNGCWLIKNNNHGKSIGYLDWDFVAGKPSTSKLIKINKMAYDSDPKIAKLVDDYEIWLRKHYIDVEKNKNQATKNLPVKVPYVNNHSCGTCHPQITASWQETRHARAYASLQKKCKDFCPDCLPCHVTGSRDHGKQGFHSPTATPNLFNIQCEECHGPAENHIKDPKLPYGKKITTSTCTICHTANSDPEFFFADDLKLINH